MDVSYRIKILIEKLNLDAKSFALRLDINPSSISHLTSGRNKPSFDFLQKIVEKFPNVNIYWLLTGKGEILKNEEINYVKQEDTEEEKKSTDVNKNSDKIAKEKKEIEKIILFYTDGSFKIYENENL